MEEVVCVLRMDSQIEQQKVRRRFSFSCISNATAVTYADEDEEGMDRSKFVWPERCLHHHLCFQGKRSGRVRMTCSFCATYVDDFVENYIHGYGHYTMGGGENYEGQWMMNKKHGFGKERYKNGDVYEGFWRSGVLYGHGKYIWSSGDLYTGQWRGGVMWGDGILVWASGHEYCGEFVNGLQHGHGLLWLGDGRFFFGRWEESLLIGEVRYNLLDAGFESLKSKFKKGILSSDGSVLLECPEVFLNYLCSKFEVADRNSQLHCDLGTGVQIVDRGLDVLGLLAPQLLDFQRGDQCKSKRLGEVLLMGHRNYELVRALQLGIRNFSGQYMDSDLDFGDTKITRIQFPKHDQRHSPGTVTDFEWKDYCPLVFRQLQELDNIDNADYMLSICGHETLRELSSPGKSGCLLYLSHDDRFVIKTMRKSEMKVLLEILPNYYDHVKKYGTTLLPKFYGHHAVSPAGGYKVYFVVMRNVLQSDLYIHRRFDLKGSSQGRSASKVAVDDSTTFKDLDLDFSFHLDPSTRQRLLTQIRHDCEFLEAEGIMDYSLLLGMHVEAPIRGSANGRSLTTAKTFPPDSSWRHFDNESTLGDKLQQSYMTNGKLGVKMPARAVRIHRNEKGRTASPNVRVGARDCYNVKLYAGIIDILQGYNVIKRIEHAYKSLQFDSRSISAVNPTWYSLRLQDFLCKVFPADEADS